MIKENPLISKLIALNLPKEDYAVFGSGPMFAHGIKDLGSDVDLIARGKAWEKACQIGDTKKAALSNNKVVILFEGDIEIFNGWAPGEWNVDKLIDEAEIIDGIRFVSLENVVRWKKLMGREKDLTHIQMINDYKKSREKI